MKPVKAEYKFTETYDVPGKPTADVYLTIDYGNKLMTIEPMGGSDFNFRSSGAGRAELWKAVARAIIKATEFAEKELSQPNSQPDPQADAKNSTDKNTGKAD